MPLHKTVKHPPTQSFGSQRGEYPRHRIDLRGASSMILGYKFILHSDDSLDILSWSTSSFNLITGRISKHSWGKEGKYKKLLIPFSAPHFPLQENELERFLLGLRNKEFSVHIFSSIAVVYEK